MFSQNSDEQPWTLVTDLDGTFLNGSIADQMVITRAVESGLLRVVYVTGRAIESLGGVLYDPVLPKPAFVIADVGATVVEGSDFRPFEPLQSEIAERWPGESLVQTRLHDSGLRRRQPVPQERRCSYFAKPEDVTAQVRAAVEELGCDLLFSNQKYLDVLPRGVSKGATFLRLAQLANINLSRVVVAGDTLNDLSLFQIGAQGIAVSNSEDKLLSAIRSLDSVYIAQRPGTAGILEGLYHKGVMKRPAPLCEPNGRADGVPLVMVYHRRPFEVVLSGTQAQVVLPKSPNGILPTLQGLHGLEEHVWVASGETNPSSPDGHNRLHTVPLSDEDISIFYKQFSKEALWPILHSFPGKASFSESHWEHFRRINLLFAQKSAELTGPNGLVWVHDYNLWLVPGFLKRLRPDVSVAFFHHTPFPSSQVFNTIPWRSEVIGSLVRCDYVGFHTPRDVDNFWEVVRTFAPCINPVHEQCAPRFVTYGSAIATDSLVTRFELEGRVVGLGAHPVGLDIERMRRLVQSPATFQGITRVEQLLQGRRMILSAGRLDYTKGFPEQLRAFELMLERHRDLIGRVEFVLICPPPAEGIEVYAEVRRQIDELVGRINGRFSTVDWTPIRYLFRNFPFEELIPYFLMADVCWLTPLRDGLNLVAKEFVALKHLSKRTGILVVSEFAGVALELFGAILTNPYDRVEMSKTLFRALEATANERRERTRRMFDCVNANSLDRWGKEFLKQARQVRR